jgi:hypothetical protein
MRAYTNAHRSGPRQPLLPDQHERLMEHLSSLLDDTEREIVQAEGIALIRLKQRSRRLLRKILIAEAEHVEMCEPVCWRPASNGKGIVVVTRGGWECWLPHHTAEDMEVIGVDLVAF